MGRKGRKGACGRTGRILGRGREKMHIYCNRAKALLLRLLGNGVSPQAEAGIKLGKIGIL
jgi:hypothetical protein